MSHAPTPDRLAEQIFQDLRLHIIRGTLPAGGRLPAERALAEAYGANRNTVREAIRKLEQGRLVRVRHGQGVTVADYRTVATAEIIEPYLEACTDPEERLAVMRDLLEARNEVLCYAVELACRRAGPAHRERLHAVAVEVREAAARHDALAVARLTQAWIEALIDASGSLPVRWLANAFLHLHARLVDRFPILCVIEPSLPSYLESFLEALDRPDPERGRELTHAYFEKVDALLLERVRHLSAFVQPARTAPPWAGGSSHDRRA